MLKRIRVGAYFGAGLLTAVLPGISAAASRPALGVGGFGETVSYPFTNFRSSLPGVWPGRPDDQGSVVREPGRKHKGRSVVRLNWSLPSRNPANNFVNFFWHRKLLGRPVAVQASIYAPPRDVGATVVLWLSDATGQDFLSRLSLNRAGWNLYRFPVAGIPAAWKSGAGDGVQHLPLQLFGLSLEWPGHTGHIRLSGLTVVAQGPARQFVTCSPMAAPRSVTDVPHFTGWGKPPLCRLDVENYSGVGRGRLALSLAARNALTGRVVWRTRLPIPRLPGRGVFEASFTPAVGNGVFNLRYSVWAKGQKLPNASGTVRLARMMGAVSEKSGKSARVYARRWGLAGGIFWQCPPERAAATGAFWQRYQGSWLRMEPRPGEFDFLPAVRGVQLARQAGLAVDYLAVLYGQPLFYRENRASFAPAYGRMLAGLAAALRRQVHWYELGNEDNGTTKYLYTEVARNGAAAVRSADPMAMLCNSATAGVDLGWLQMQSRRGLFSDLDAVATHPYTWGESPEKFGVLRQLRRVNRFIDGLGGMKFQLTTEFGYSQARSNKEEPFVGQRARAEYIVRHFAIQAAAGLLRGGLYSWDGDFGIYNEGQPYPAAAAVNAFCDFTYASRFVGWWQRDKRVWAVMFERAGKPLLMAWSPLGQGTLTLRGAPVGARVWDIYGNLLPASRPQGQLILHLTGAPMYVTGLPPQALLRPLANAARHARRRYARVLASSSLRSIGPWKRMAAVDAPPLGQLTTLLRRWRPTGRSISPATQAVIAESVRRLILAAHARAITSPGATAKYTGAHRATWRRWVRHVTSSVRREGIDLPAVRWTLYQWQRTRDEAAMCHELGDDRLAALLSSLDPVFNHLCAVLAARGPRVFFPIWPYLYQGGKRSPLVETLQFVSGKAVPLKMRLDSYASRTYAARVTLKLPRGWRATPRLWAGRVVPGRPRVVRFVVTAGANVTKTIFATLSVPGRPPVRLPYSCAVLPALGVAVAPVPALLPRAPILLGIINHGARKESVALRLYREPGNRPLGPTETASLGVGGRACLIFHLPANTMAPAFNAWHLLVRVRAGSGRVYEIPLAVDFDAAVHALGIPVIGGPWRQWAGAAPLHLNEPGYTYGSFGDWRRRDLSAVVYTMWNRRELYLAVRVRSDRPFRQALEGGAVWEQDSVQFALAPVAGRGYSEFSLAQTARGPQVWDYQSGRLARAAQLHVRVRPGEVVYQCALPWSDVPGVEPVVGARCRFDVLINKDYGGHRVYMERYGTAIVNATHDPAAMGWLHFLGS